MKQVIQSYRTGELTIAEVPAPVAQPGQVLVRNRFSLISAGTERASIALSRKSLAGKAADRPDLVAQVLGKMRTDGVSETLKMVNSRLDAPVAPGYSCAGEVIDVGAGVSGYRIGDRVACAGQDYASHAEIVSVPKNLTVQIPEDVAYGDAAYVTVGAIALQGVRQASPALGEVVAVIGCGLLGALTIQLLKANGCTVVASDPAADRRAFATRLGVEAAVSPEDLIGAVSEHSEGMGADAVIITASSKSNAPVETAAGIARKKGRIVVVGAVPMDLPREPFYRKELDLRLSTSYGPGRYDPAYEEGGQDYPHAYVRWTQKRNMSAFLGLIETGTIDVSVLTTHEFPIHRADEAYELVSSGQAAILGILLSYPSDAPPPKSRRLDLTARTVKADPKNAGTVGIIGAGTHILDRIAPALSRTAGLSVAAACTRSGKNASRAGARLGASYVTTDYTEILDDPEIAAVIVGTRHDLHAEIVERSLNAGKHVFVEKPLCLNVAELERITQIYAEKANAGINLFVGYNRRYSEHCQAARVAIAAAAGPANMIYRVNAGPLPPEHWLRDPDIGGGRIIGEGCHFIDTMQFLCGAHVTSVFARSTGAETDDVVISCAFSDGSIGTLAYSGSGDKRAPKERCEIFRGGTAIFLDDYRRTEIFRGGKRKTVKSRGQDKGFGAEMQAFSDAIAGDPAATQDFAAIHAVSQATFLALESITGGGQLPVHPLSVPSD